MNNKKLLIFGDIHEDTGYIEEIITKESPDETIFVGDYFDSFISTTQTAQRTCEWLKESIHKPNRIHLLGNHECFYRWPLVTKFVCSGNTIDKCKFINSILKFDDWNKIQLFHFDGTYLYSHAGVSEKLFAHCIEGVTLGGITKECERAIEVARAGGVHPILQAGYSRGGNQPQGGLLWQDHYIDTTPITGWKQIYGHTPHKSPNSKYINLYTPNKKDALGINYCIDFSGIYYTTITDGKFEYKLTGSAGYNVRKRKLLGEPFVDGRRIIEHTTKVIDDGECATTPVVQWDNPSNRLT